MERERTTFPKKLVERGLDIKAREESLQWEWGDLLLEVAPVGKPGAHNQTYFRISDFLQTVYPEEEHAGDRANTFRHYRDVAARFPHVRRQAGKPWSVFAELSYVSDEETRWRLVEQVNTVAEAREARYGANAWKRWQEAARRPKTGKARGKFGLGFDEKTKTGKKVVDALGVAEAARHKKWGDALGVSDPLEGVARNAHAIAGGLGTMFAVLSVGAQLYEAHRAIVEIADRLSGRKFNHEHLEAIVEELDEWRPKIVAALDLVQAAVDGEDVAEAAAQWLQREG